MRTRWIVLSLLVAYAQAQEHTNTFQLSFVKDGEKKDQSLPTTVVTGDVQPPPPEETNETKVEAPKSKSQFQKDREEDHAALQATVPERLGRVNLASLVNSADSLSAKQFARQLKLLSDELDSAAVTHAPINAEHSIGTKYPALQNHSHSQPGVLGALWHEPEKTTQPTLVLPTVTYKNGINPEETGLGICMVYLDCTARLEIEKNDCLHSMVETDLRNREEFFHELKMILANNPPLGATPYMADGCFQYAVRNYPQPPSNFPVDFVLDRESKIRREECLHAPFKPCSISQTTPIVAALKESLQTVSDAKKRNQTYEECRANHKQLMDSCLNLRSCCQFARHCDEKAGRKHINVPLSSLEEPPVELMKQEALDCLALRATEALPTPPVTLSPLRVWLRSHHDFPSKA